MDENLIAGSKPAHVEKNHDYEKGFKGADFTKTSVESTYLVNSRLWSSLCTDALSAQPT